MKHPQEMLWSGGIAVVPAGSHLFSGINTQDMFKQLKAIREMFNLQESGPAGRQVLGERAKEGILGTGNHRRAGFAPQGLAGQVWPLQMPRGFLWEGERSPWNHLSTAGMGKETPKRHLFHPCVTRRTRGGRRFE